jgi:hypothetical protein
MLPRLVVRLAASSLLWLFAAGMAGACLFAQGPVSLSGADDEWAALCSGVLFASSLVIAGAAALVAGLAVADQRRWALEALGALLVTIAVLGVLVYVCLWLDPWLVRSQMSGNQFVRLRDVTFYLSVDVVRYAVPFASVVGLLVGMTAGLLAVNARRRPRAVMALVAVLVLASIAVPVQRSAFDLVILWGYVVRRCIDSPGMSHPFVSALGAIAGAIAGSTIAVVMRWHQQKRLVGPGAVSAPS